MLNAPAGHAAALSFTGGGREEAMRSAIGRVASSLSIFAGDLRSGRPEKGQQDMKMSTMSSVFVSSSRTQLRPERRREERKRLVYRLVHVEHRGDQGLGRCRNISSDGMQLELTMPGLAVGTRFKVAFSSIHVFEATVIWSRDRQYGIALDEPVDYETMLRESAAHTRARGFPRLRPNEGLLAMLRCEGRTRETRIRELTQQELKLTHDGNVRPNLHLSVKLGGGREMHGVVRASNGNVAEVVLSEPFSVGELGSIAMLAAAADRSWSRLYIDAR